MRVDPAFADIIADRRMALREPPLDIGIEVLRKAADSFMGASMGPELLSVSDIAVPGPTGSISIRLYRPSDAANLPLILFIHGGGFVFGSIETHDAFCRSLTKHSGVVVASVGYRLAPETRFPGALNDCVEALGGLVAAASALGIDCSRIAIVGDSAGGQLAIATTIAAEAIVPPIRHLGLFYPLIDPACDTVSGRLFAQGYMLTRSFIIWAWRSYAGRMEDHDNPLFDVTKGNMHLLPSVTIITAGYDPLRDEGEAFGARLRDSGTDVSVSRYEDMIHGFAGFPDMTPRADQAIREVALACRRAFGISEHNEN